MPPLRKKKASLTLLEVIIAIFLTGILLSTLWSTYLSWYKTYQKIQTLQNKTQKTLFFTQKIEKLCLLLANTPKEKAIFSQEDKNGSPCLCFCYEGEADINPAFTGQVRSLIYLNNQKELYLATFSSEVECRLEKLKEGVKNMELAFFDLQKDNWTPTWDDALDHLPLWIKITLESEEEKQEFLFETHLPEGPILYLKDFKEAP